MKARVLLVEDHMDFAVTLKIQLEENGYAVTLAADGEQGLAEALQGDYSLVVLDISLPKKDGLEVLSEIRKHNAALPVMMLTSRAEELDKVAGLTLGADDYVTKPFTVAEFFARVNALLRRTGASGSPGASLRSKPLVFGDLSIDCGSRTVKLKGSEVALSPKEYELLALLAGSPGQAFSREELIEKIWQYNVGDYAQSVNNTVMQLRKKIESDPASPVFLLTVRGYGYRFAREDEV